MPASEFASKLRQREPVVGYWSVLEAPVATERLAGAGYDYLVLDGQHGHIGYAGLVNALMAVDAANSAVGLVRVEANHMTPIGRALDAGAAGVIVPLVDTAEDAAAAVAAARYPPVGVRSYGPVRSSVRIGPTPAVANSSTVVLAMVETRLGLANVEAIAATEGLDGIFIGPSDLALALGAAEPGDPQVRTAFDEALVRIRQACDVHQIAAGIYTTSGDAAAARLAEGFSNVCVASDLDHLEEAAGRHVAAARGSDRPS